MDALWYFGSAIGSYHIEKLSACNLKRTFVSYGVERDWFNPTQGAGSILSLTCFLSLEVMFFKHSITHIYTHMHIYTLFHTHRGGVPVPGDAGQEHLGPSRGLTRSPPLILSYIRKSFSFHVIFSLSFSFSISILITAKLPHTNLALSVGWVGSKDIE